MMDQLKNKMELVFEMFFSDTLVLKDHGTVTKQFLKISHRSVLQFVGVVGADSLE